jgi:hypothetical protein
VPHGGFDDLVGAEQERQYGQGQIARSATVHGDRHGGRADGGDARAGHEIGRRTPAHAAHGTTVGFRTPPGAARTVLIEA